MYKSLKLKEAGARNKGAEDCIKIRVISVIHSNVYERIIVKRSKEGWGWREGAGSAI